ncbi:MAG TPA: hypothetical protein VIG33_06565 [Pseudobdellovibrionaceae bacterium]
MTAKITAFVFTILGSFPLWVSAYQDNGTNKTCTGTVLVVMGENSAPLDMSLALIRSAGSTQGQFTMTVFELFVSGAYTVNSKDFLEASFEIPDKTVTTTGSIHQIDKDSVGFTATMMDKSPDGSTKSLSLLAPNLTCVNN